MADHDPLDIRTRPTDHNPHSDPVDPIDNVPTKKPNFIQRSWAWLNGKKTLIGGVVLAAGLCIPGPWGIALKAIGGPLATTGILHKVGKASKKYGKPGEFGKDDLLSILSDLFSVLKRLWDYLKKQKGNTDG